MPPWVSWTRGAGLPGQGSADSDLTTTAPSDPRSTKRPSSSPWPAVPDAVMIGPSRVTEPTWVVMVTVAARATAQFSSS